MTQREVIKSLPQAFEVIKEMGMSEAAELDYRRAGRQALSGFLEGRMHERIDRHLEEMAARGAADRRNGFYRRRLLSALGDIELSVPRTRTYSAGEVLRAYARRTRDIDRLILSCFVLGISTRKVSRALLPILGEAVSAATVSRSGQAGGAGGPGSYP